MIGYVKKGIQDIKDTRKYAREKNVPNWYVNLIGAVFTAFIGSMIASIYGIIFISNANPNGLILNFFGYSIVAFPFVLTFMVLMSIGKYILKAMIYFTYLIQQGLMKLINYLDMYLWRKTGKDGMASNFMIKHRKIVQFMIFVPLIILTILRHLPK